MNNLYERDGETRSKTLILEPTTASAQKLRLLTHGTRRRQFRADHTLDAMPRRDTKLEFCDALLPEFKTPENLRSILVGIFPCFPSIRYISAIPKC